MAGFYDTRTLDRQERRINPEYVTGLRRTALGLLGYKKTGERNTWGKISSGINILNPGSDLRRHHAAKALSKGTDTHEALKANDAQALNVAFNKLKLAGEVAKVVATSGAGAGASAAGGAAGAGASAASGAAGAGATAGGVSAGGSSAAAASGGMGGFGTIFSGAEGQTGSALLDDVLMQGDMGGLGGPKAEPPPEGDMIDPDYSSYVPSPDYQNTTGDGTSTVDKLKNFNSKLDMITNSGLIGSGVNTVNAMRLYNMTGERTARDIRGRSTSANFNYL